MNVIRPAGRRFVLSYLPPGWGLARKVLRAPIEIASWAHSGLVYHRPLRRCSSQSTGYTCCSCWASAEKGSILIFVDPRALVTTFSGADQVQLFVPVSDSGKDQLARDYSIADFKKRCGLGCTSLAGRGSGCRGVCLVVNFTSPNHLEDYVHRVGRTAGRGAGRPAFDPAEGRFSNLVKALRTRERRPAELQR